MPAVSVVIPVRGDVAFVYDAVASVATDGSASVELIVVEDGTAEVDADRLQAIAPGTIYLRLPYGGRSRTRNAGVERASRDLVAFLDADDLNLPGRFARQAETLERNPEKALCFGRIVPIDEASQPLPPKLETERGRVDRLLARGLTFSSLLVDCPIWTSATMVRREIFTKVGGYRPEIDAFEDLDLYLRLIGAGGLIFCAGEPVACHRIHPGNTPSAHLFVGSVILARLHLADGGRSASERRLLLEREIDGLWALGDFPAVRAKGRSALRSDLRLLGNRRFRKRLAASSLPLPVLRRLRGRS